MLRKFLAETSGFQCSVGGNVNLGGSSVGSVTGPGGERLVDLTRYCQVLNLQLNTNQLLGTASFTVGAEQVVIPLAAKKVKDGGRWIDTNDISVIKGGKWYVSYAALQDAVGH
jgi:hypothetical protein